MFLASLKVRNLPTSKPASDFRLFDVWVSCMCELYNKSITSTNSYYLRYDKKNLSVILNFIKIRKNDCNTDSHCISGGGMVR